MKSLAAAVLVLLMTVALGFAAAPQSASTQSTTTTKTTTTRKHSSSSKESSSAKLDINSASQQELEALPGIGPATSAKIVQGRPYRAKSDLLKRKVVSRSEYDKIKDEIVAHQQK
jgi:DNA uptake protein ComE-like DNA-binding protein